MVYLLSSQPIFLEYMYVIFASIYACSCGTLYIVSILTSTYESYLDKDREEYEKSLEDNRTLTEINQYSYSRLGSQ